MQEQYAKHHLKITTIQVYPTRTLNLLAMVCFGAMLLMRDVVGIEIGRYVFISIAAIVCLNANKAGIYCFLAFLTPLAPGIPLTYISGIALTCLLFKQRNDIRINTIGLICMVAILLWELFLGFRGMFSIVDYFRFSAIFLIVFLRIFDCDKNYDNEGMLKYYLIGFVVAIISILGQMVTSFSMDQIFSLAVRFGNTRQLLENETEGMLLSYNPNGLACLCILAMLFSIIIAKENKNKIYYLVAVLSGILGIMTQSRTFILELIACAVLYFFTSMNSLKKMLISIMRIISAGAVLYFIVQKLIPSYLSSLLLRFQEADVYGGRSEIFQYYMSQMWEHFDRLLFGVGLQNYSAKYGYYMSAHNGIQEVVIAWGIIGLIVVTIMVMNMFSFAHFQNRNAFMYRFVPMIAILLFVQTEQWFFITSNLFRLMVAFSAILMPVQSEPQAGLYNNDPGKMG